MTREERLERELAKAPKPAAEDVWWVLNRFGFPPEQVEAAYEAMLREKGEDARRQSGAEAAMRKTRIQDPGGQGTSYMSRGSETPGRGADSHPVTYLVSLTPDVDRIVARPP
ncbi:hypothetical protein J7I94_34045 [Streptomyces sp. ISL-12]|uniref:hypothetical protein n=1 Tax=Streptomyces sp. ISL-12 TaxID=2819177 RepID=UPI001BE60380|nr:hypothetical protein [Streptomyces sp. ISL-12]MBT2415498.1 hypothetical protein [Streptomyces sp. ISL-12]